MGREGGREGSLARREGKPASIPGSFLHIWARRTVRSVPYTHERCSTLLRYVKFLFRAMLGQFNTIWLYTVDKKFCGRYYSFCQTPSRAFPVLLSLGDTFMAYVTSTLTPTATASTCTSKSQERERGRPQFAMHEAGYSRGRTSPFCAVAPYSIVPLHIVPKSGLRLFDVDFG